MEKSLLHITQVRWVEESVQPVEVFWSSVATLQSLITQLVMVDKRCIKSIMSYPF